MSTFKFNDHFCLSARQLKKEADTHGFSTEEWYGRANSFTMRRGVEPAEGYLLVHQFDAAATNNLQITYRNVSDGNVTTEIGTKTFHHLKVKTARKITPAASREKGYYLVHVVDERYALEDDLVGKRFNLVLDFEEAESPNPYGTFKYHQDTTDGVDNPYTWQRVFEEVWEVPSGLPLDFSDIVTLDYPKHVPQDVDFRYVTRKMALMMLCQWCNFTILVTNSGTYKVARINDTGDQLTNLLKTYEDARLKSKDRYVDLDDPGYPEPKTYELYFKRLSPISGIREHEQIIASANYPSKSSDKKEPFELPLVTPTTVTAVDPNYQIANAADAFVLRQKPYFGMFPPQERTYHGFLNLDCKAYLDEITWYNLTGRGYTRIKSVCWPDWKIRPIDPNSLEIEVGTAVDPIPVGTLGTVRRPEDNITIEMFNASGRLILAGEKVSYIEDQILATETPTILLAEVVNAETEENIGGYANFEAANEARKSIGGTVSFEGLTPVVIDPLNYEAGLVIGDSVYFALADNAGTTSPHLYLLGTPHTGEGGGGGGGDVWTGWPGPDPTTGLSPVKIIKARVDKAGGVTGADATFDFDDTSAIVGTPPAGGTAINTFGKAFCDDETFIAYADNEGDWHAVKLHNNIIYATVNQSGGVRSSTTEFSFDAANALEGFAPATGTGTAKNILGWDWYDNEPFLAQQADDGKWIVLAKAWTGGLLMRTTSNITAASWNAAASLLTLGNGTAKILNPVATGSATMEIVGANITIYNSVQQQVPINRNVQVKYIGSRLVVDVAECGN